MKNIFGKKNPHFNKDCKDEIHPGVLGNPSHRTTNNDWVEFTPMSSKIQKDMLT